MMESDSVTSGQADQERSLTQLMRASETSVHPLNSEGIKRRLRERGDSMHTVFTRPAVEVTVKLKPRRIVEGTNATPSDFKIDVDSVVSNFLSTDASNEASFTASEDTTSSPSQVVVTSITTIPATAPGQTPSIVTRVSTILAVESAATPDQDGSMPNDTKIALGVGIPAGIILVIVLVIGGFIFGRRAAKSANTGRRRLWKSSGKNKQACDIPERLCLLASREKPELWGGRPPQELPTQYNVQELPEERRVVELPQKSPVKLREDLL